jgi:anti-sigma B factor antagonist
MPDIQVDVKYSGANNEIAIIAARGFIDTTTAPDLEKKLEEQLALNKYKIIVNLENIDYVSSAGWGVFVSEIREIRENNGDLVLVNMSSDVYDVYELMEFSSILKSFDNLEDAVANFSGAKIAQPVVKPKQAPPRLAEPRRSPEKAPELKGSPRAEPKAGPKPEPKLEQAPVQSAPTSPKSDDLYTIAKTDVGKKILDIIVENPYFEIKDIGKALRLPQYGGLKVGGGQIKKELRDMNLLDRQRRFELALKRSR